MRVFGVDFTSAPSRKKPITVAEGQLKGDMLTYLGSQALETFADFEAFLSTPGPWVAALDFPFAMPKELLTVLGWPTQWSESVAAMAALGKDAFEAKLNAYRESRPAGEKYVYRETDRVTKSSSPMKLHYPPVGKMFFQGAPRLLRAGVCVVPCRMTIGEARYAVEAYPALIARRFAQSYKAEEAVKQTDARRACRQQILAGLAGSCFQEEFGLTVVLCEQAAAFLIEDASGDRLDAWLAATQAAYAWSRRHDGWGIPQRVDPDEGWIIDPRLV
jgi:hypothetical protein